MIDLTRPELCNVLRAAGPVVQTLVLEMARATDDNKAGMFSHPVAACVGFSGALFMLDVNVT